MSDTALNYLRDYVKANGYAPSVREMADDLDMSPTTVQARFKDWETEGLIERVGPRAIRITEE